MDTNAIASEWLLGGLLTVQLTKPFWERFLKRSDKGADKVERLEKEIEEIKLALAEKVSRQEFNKLMMKLSEIEGYIRAKGEK